jgi:hypothetical protein
MDKFLKNLKFCDLGYVFPIAEDTRMRVVTGLGEQYQRMSYERPLVLSFFSNLVGSKSRGAASSAAIHENDTFWYIRGRATTLNYSYCSDGCPKPASAYSQVIGTFGSGLFQKLSEKYGGQHLDTPQELQFVEIIVSTGWYLHCELSMLPPIYHPLIVEITAGCSKNNP